jgi:hypothetical protein
MYDPLVYHNVKEGTAVAIVGCGGLGMVRSSCCVLVCLRVRCVCVRARKSVCVCVCHSVWLVYLDHHISSSSLFITKLIEVCADANAGV